MGLARRDALPLDDNVSSHRRSTEETQGTALHHVRSRVTERQAAVASGIRPTNPWQSLIFDDVDEADLELDPMDYGQSHRARMVAELGSSARHVYGLGDRGIHQQRGRGGGRAGGNSGGRAEQTVHRFVPDYYHCTDSRTTKFFFSFNCTSNDNVKYRTGTKHAANDGDINSQLAVAHGNQAPAVTLKRKEAVQHACETSKASRRRDLSTSTAGRTTAPASVPHHPTNVRSSRIYGALVDPEVFLKHNVFARKEAPQTTTEVEPLVSKASSVTKQDDSPSPVDEDEEVAGFRVQVKNNGVIKGTSYFRVVKSGYAECENDGHIFWKDTLLANVQYVARKREVVFTSRAPDGTVINWELLTSLPWQASHLAEKMELHKPAINKRHKYTQPSNTQYTDDTQDHIEQNLISFGSGDESTSLREINGTIARRSRNHYSLNLMLSLRNGASKPNMDTEENDQTKFQSTKAFKVIPQGHASDPCSGGLKSSIWAVPKDREVPQVTVRTPRTTGLQTSIWAATSTSS